MVIISIFWSNFLLTKPKSVDGFKQWPPMFRVFSFNFSGFGFSHNKKVANFMNKKFSKILKRLIKADFHSSIQCQIGKQSRNNF